MSTSELSLPESLAVLLGGGGLIVDRRLFLAGTLMELELLGLVRWSAASRAGLRKLGGNRYLNVEVIAGGATGNQAIDTAVWGLSRLAAATDKPVTIPQAGRAAGVAELTGAFFVRLNTIGVPQATPLVQAMMQTLVAEALQNEPFAPRVNALSALLAAQSFHSVLAGSGVKNLIERAVWAPGLDRHVLKQRQQAVVQRARFSMQQSPVASVLAIEFDTDRYTNQV